MIGAEKRPIPWWGPFDGADAIGRTLLLAGMWVFGIFSRIVISVFESAATAEPWDFQDTPRKAEKPLEEKKKKVKEKE